VNDDMLEDREAGDDQSPDGPVEPADVLVVDDNALNRTAITRLLRRDGLSVISTDSAIGATRLVLRCGVSVVVADLNMPAMQGSSLLTVFRRNPRLAHVAVVLLSGVSADELVKAASEVGADAAVSKLDMTTMLLPAVHRLLRRALRPKQVSGKFSLPPSILTVEQRKRGSTGT
jgi:CheY-like chemotaxis protein